ncbi:uncharacterized protein LOC131957736 [Physella acuta]|uniref:uncharacterized protein LOC131957736 n=1 Tax=Physella acuta TaxID=109671 RepID=UPI0027DD664F|nr:uncharacterized protein LOC131957736 [Physella acuta]
MYKHRRVSLLDPPINRSWSLYTSYAGVAGIHSEVQAGAATRNALLNRKSSDTITTVQTLHRKDLQSIRFNRRSLEHSMVAYTEKMKDIAEKKMNDDNGSNESLNLPMENIQLRRKISRDTTGQEGVRKNSFLPPLNSDSPKSHFKSESIQSPQQSQDMTSMETHEMMGGNGAIFLIRKKQSADDIQEEKSSNQQNRRRRVGVYMRPDIETSDFHAQVNQSENAPDRHESTNADIAETGECILISPYPEYHRDLRKKRNIEVEPPVTKPGYWSYRTLYSPRRDPSVAPKRKPSRLPRMTGPRRPRPPPVPCKPVHQVFQYSSAVERALLGLVDEPCVIDLKNRVYRSKANLVSIDIDEIRHAHSLRPIRESSGNAGSDEYQDTTDSSQPNGHFF